LRHSNWVVPGLPRPESWAEAFDPVLILRYTRHWIHYGSIAFAVICTLIAALRGIAGG
jgi:hypothetical protein